MAMRNRINTAMVVALLACGTAVAQTPPAAPAYHPAPQGAQLDLQKPFHARSPWRLIVTEGPRVRDAADFEAPGALTLCLRNGPAGSCVSDPVRLPLNPPTPDYDAAWEPHYLRVARVVYPRGPQAAPFLLIVTGSLESGDGDQDVATQLLGYDADHDAFRRVYARSTGRNNNQEIRFISDGPLRGGVVSAEPTEKAPYGYWIEVERWLPGDAYRKVLRYRSATHYGDGNPLAVIDSEMPEIERRLGLWRPGQPLPTPATVNGKPCVKPALRHSELWCR